MFPTMSECQHEARRTSQRAPEEAKADLAAVHLYGIVDSGAG